LEWNVEESNKRSLTGIGVDGTLEIKASGNGVELEGAPTTTDAGTVKQTAGNVTYVGDNSGFKGKFELENSQATIAEKGKMFGGNINLHQDSELIWCGGEKDSGNRPDITMFNNAKLVFQLPEIGDNKIFSVYGTIKTNETSQSNATISISSGEILIKNDCSGFKGNLQISPNAVLKIINDDDHCGKMFGGSISVLNGGSITVNTQNGLVPLHVKEGTVTLSNENLLERNIEQLTVEKDATINLEFADAIISGASYVEGVLQIGQNADFEVLEVHGGTLKITEGVDIVTFNKIQFGSLLDTMNNEITELSTNQLELLKHGGDMNWQLDFNLDNQKCDHFKAASFSNPGGKFLVISDYKMQGIPIDDVYIFNIMNIGGGDPYPHIEVTAGDFPSEYGIYRLQGQDGTGNVIMKLISGLSIKHAYESVLTEHDSAMFSISDMLDSIHDNLMDNEIRVGKCCFWNKSRISNYELEVVGSDALHSKCSSTIFGFDTEPLALDSNMKFAPTVFMGCVQENLHNTSVESKNSGTLGGIKLAWFDADAYNFSIIGSYGVIKTNSKYCFVRSQLLSASARGSSNLPLKDDVFIVPALQLEYSKIMSGDAKMKHGSIEGKNIDRLRFSAAINLQMKQDFFRTSVGIKFNKRFGRKIFTKINDMSTESPIQIASSNLEYSINVNGKINSHTSVDLAIGKSCCGRSGAFMNLNLGIDL
jgi:hypothetical protein